MISDDYQARTRAAYDHFAPVFDEKFGAHFVSHVLPLAQAFVTALPGKRVLDIGSGPGHHAAYFLAQGLDVLCGDLSPVMIERCRQKGLQAQVMDLEALELPPGSFDGIWAYACLLHVAKSKIAPILKQFWLALQPRGILCVAVKDGEGERMEQSTDYPGEERLFTYFHDAEVRRLVESDFRLLDQNSTTVHGRHIFLNYLLQKQGG